MKRNLLLFSLFGLFVFFISCDKEEEPTPPPPSAVAKFTYTATNDQVAPTIVTFTNESIAADTYAWDFGDETTSTDENPTHEYTEPGNYTVTLTATNETSSNEATEVIVIKDPYAGLANALYFGDVVDGKVFYQEFVEQPVLQPFESGGLGRPYSIAIDKDNEKVYVADYGNGAIMSYDLDGSNPASLLDYNNDPDFVSYPSGITLMGDKIIWGDDAIGIVKADLDGSNPELLFTASADAAPEYPIGLAYDAANNHIYLINDAYDYSGGLWRMNADGTGMTELIAGLDATALAIDTENGALYFAEYAVGIVKTKLDGTGEETVGTTGDKATNGVKVDVANGKIYWSVKNSSDAKDGYIMQANLDGTEAVKFIDNVNPNGIGLLLYR